MARVKICGICTPDALDASVRAGADAVGFVVDYPDPVPWNLDREHAGRLVERAPPFVSTVLVTTGDVETVVGLATDVRPDVVQLHGDESPTTVGAVVDELAVEGIGTIKAVPISADDGPDRSDDGQDRSDGEPNRSDDGTDRLADVREFASTGVDAILLDAEAEDRKGGGTGETVPWDLARRIVDDASLPVVLAGGLTPETVAEAVETVNPYAVDVISGVEREDHRKDPDLVGAFVDAASSR